MLQTLEVPRPSHGQGVAVVEYTDPYSIWCWGCEPALRRVEYLYPDSVEIRHVMGGLFEDFTPMREYWSRMSGGKWKDAVQTFLTAVAAQHGMPINAEGMMESLDDFRTTWPACIAVTGAFLQGVKQGTSYLRRLREAVLVEGRDIGARDVQAGVAAEAGLDAEALVAALEDGSALAAFRRDLTECRLQGVSGFPSFDLRSGEASLRLEGYRNWEAFDEALRSLDSRLAPRLVPETDEGVMDVLRHFGRCASREVAAVLGTTDDDAEIFLEDLELDGHVSRRTFGPAILWELTTSENESQTLGRAP